MKPRLSSPHGQHGAGLIETMVGLLIGLIVVVVIFNLLSISEGYKRMALGTSDAQITGLIGQLMLGREAANGGNGISISASDQNGTGLINCTVNVGEAWPYATLLRPVPVLIQDSGSADISDSFISLYSGSPHVIWPVPFLADAAPNADFQVQSPTGFSSPAPATTPYRVVAINPASNDCESVLVTAATAPDASGVVTLKHTATAKSYKFTTDPAAKLVNLGPVGMASRTLYEVWDTNTDKSCTNGAGQCQLFSTDLLTAGAVRNPIGQNIVLMKVQYGVDLSSPIDGTIDCWTPADAANICGAVGPLPVDFQSGTVRSFGLTNLQRIIAVRVGLVVRNDEPEPKLAVAGANLNYAVRPAMYLFNCAANNGTCQSRIKLSNNVIQNGWRYRTYETVIPLRNAIFNALP
jgi:type IV pilus assembly protein PilW